MVGKRGVSQSYKHYSDVVCVSVVRPCSVFLESCVRYVRVLAKLMGTPKHGPQRTSAHILSMG